MIDCPECHGEGEIIEDVIDWGTVVKYKCWFCGGKGRVNLWVAINQWLYFNSDLYCRIVDWWHDR